MQEITVKNFKGVNLDEGKWQDAFASYVQGLDIWGLAKNPSKISYPGILQGIFKVSAGTQAAGVSGVSEAITDFARYNSNDFALGSASASRLYRRDSGSWTKASAITVSTTASNSGAMKVYGANLYIATKGFIGFYDNTNSNANWQSLTDTTASPRKMVILNGTLYGLDNRYIWSYDGTTFTAAKLTLPSDITLRSIDVYGDRMYFTGDNGFQSSFFIWDGVANSFQTFFSIPEEQNAPSVAVAGGILWLIANRGSGTTGTPLYYFNGSELIKAQVLPVQRTNTVGFTDYAGGIAIGSNDGATATYEDGLAGVWVLNRHSSDTPYYASLLFPLRDQVTGKTLGAMSFFGQTGYIAANDTTNSTFEIFEIQGSNANTTNVWQSLPIDAGSTAEKIWHSIRVNIETLTPGITVIVKYRLNDASAFTTLKTISSTSDDKIAIPIGRSSRTITIRLELTATSTETTRLHSFSLQYTPTRK